MDTFFYKSLKNSQGITNKRDLELIKQNSDGHYLGKEFLTLLPDLLESPIAIIPSNTMNNQRQLIILDYKLNGSYVCLSVRGDGEGRDNAIRFLSTHVFSICAKEKAEYILSCRINEELEHQKYKKYKQSTTVPFSRLF